MIGQTQPESEQSEASALFTQARLPWIQRLLLAAIAVPAIWQLSILATAIGARLIYPFDLEWMEGGLLDHAARIQEGNGIYVPPSVDFIPYLYTPLYPSLLAVLAKIFGLHYTVGRAISVVSLLVSLAIILVATMPLAQENRKKSKRRVRIANVSAGLCGCGIVAAGYPWLEGWYDLVRGDSLFVALVLVGLVLLSVWKDRPETAAATHARIAIAGLVLALSFFCKQTGIFFVVAGGINLFLWRRWRLLPTYTLVCGAVGLGGTILFQHQTDGWFWTYIYDVFQTHDFSNERFYQGFRHIFGKTIVATIILVVALTTITLRLATRKQLPHEAIRFLFWLVPYLAAVLAGATAWGHQWAHFNAYMIAIFIGATATATGLVALNAILTDVLPRVGRWLALLLPAALAIQLSTQGWSAKQFIPTATDVANNERLIERIRSTEGEVFIPYHSWYARLAGKETYTHRMGLLDVRYKNKLKVRGLSEAFQNQHFETIILNKTTISFALSGLTPYYRLNEMIPANQRARVYTGAITQPTTIWVPNRAPPPLPKGARLITDFEHGYRGWTTIGGAWGTRPRAAAGERKNRGLGINGRYYARSEVGGNQAIGELRSPVFIIEGSRITFRLGGSKSEQLAATLVVNDTVVRRTSGSKMGNGPEMLAPVDWDVDDLRGQRATIVLVDDDVHGHLSVDAFWLWDVNEPSHPLTR